MSDDSNNTTTKQPVPPQLVGKGFDAHPAHINRKGRPKSFDKLRELAVSLANETAKDGSGQPVEFEGHTATQIEMLLRVMMRENPARFVEIAFGKVPDESENFNVNLDDLTDEQLEQIAKGKSVRSILATTRRRKVEVTPEASAAERGDKVA